MCFTKGKVILNFIVLGFACTQYAKTMEANKKFAESTTAYEVAEVNKIENRKTQFKMLML
jgi:hypothetical protein